MINIAKTKCIYFTSCQNNLDHTIRYLNHDIQSEESTKFLGMYLDSDLRWFAHVDSLCIKFNSSYFTMSRVRNLLPSQTLKNIHFSLFYSCLSYNVHMLAELLYFRIEFCEWCALYLLVSHAEHQLLKLISLRYLPSLFSNFFFMWKKMNEKWLNYLAFIIIELEMRDC